MKILHLINDLKRGGAESILIKTLEFHELKNREQIVVSLDPGNEYHKDLTKLNIPVRCFDCSNYIQIVKTLYQIQSIVNKFRPDVIQTWLYKADFIGALLQRRNARLIWTLHNGKIDRKDLGLRTFLLGCLLAKISWLRPDQIITCSRRGGWNHAQFGYCEKKMTLIQNGFDNSEFFFSPNDRLKIRRRLGLKAEDFVVGHVGRPHAHKNYQFLATIVEYVLERNKEIYFLLVGPDAHFLRKFQQQISRRRIRFGRQIKLFPKQKNLRGFYSATDMLVLTSKSEAFPLVVGEAMLCKRPCAATEVGDMTEMIPDPFWICPVEEFGQLGHIILRASRMSAVERRMVGDKNRKFILNKFPIRKMQEAYGKACTSAGK